MYQIITDPNGIEGLEYIPIGSMIEIDNWAMSDDEDKVGLVILTEYGKDTVAYENYKNKQYAIELRLYEPKTMIFHHWDHTLLLTMIRGKCARVIYEHKFENGKT